jgi:hypothetical protein
MATPPSAKPSMVSVKGSEAAPRSTPNSAWTAGNTTGMDHMPTPPAVANATDAASRIHA